MTSSGQGIRISPRCFARARPRNNRGIAPAFRRSAGCAWKLADPAWKTNQSDTLTLGFAACWTRLPGRGTRSRPSFRYAPASGSQSIGFALTRLCLVPVTQSPRRKMAGGAATGVGMKERPSATMLVIACAARPARLGRRSCFRDRTQHTLSVRSLVPRSHLNSDRPDNSPRAGPFWPELRSDNVALCVTPAAALSHGLLPAPRARAGNPCASSQASFPPTPQRTSRGLTKSVWTRRQHRHSVQFIRLISDWL